MTSSHQKAAQMLAAAADLLDQGQVVNRLSLAVTAIGAAVLLVPVFPASTAFIPTAMLVVLAGIAELLLAVRVGLDAALLRRLAEEAAADRLDVAGFDAALLSLRLMPASKAGRPIPKRFAAAKRLLAIQGAALFVQLAIAMAGAFVMFMEWV
jgi:hypothetical protein